MKKIGLASLLAFGLGLVGCGGGGSDNAVDGGGGGVDATTLPPDARPADGGGGSVDAAPQRGSIVDFDVCAVDNDCMNPSSHCRPIPYFDPPQRQCVPDCSTNGTADCPFNTVCYINPGPMGVFLKDHCWYALCGPFIGNGETNGACELGVDAFAGINNPPADKLPGYCLAISDGAFGQCMEAGTVGPGGACDFDSATQSRGGANCDGKTLCIGQTGNPTGTCAEVCDPAKILDGTPTGCTKMGEACYDSSNNVTYDDGSTARQTLGFCTNVTACSTIGPNSCPNDAMGQAQGCAASNSLRPTGICDPAATGGLAAEATCPQPEMGTPDAQQCAAGTLCTGTDAMALKCSSLCKTALKACMNDNECEPSQTCQGGKCTLATGTGPDVDCTMLNPMYTCKPLLWTLGTDMMAGTPDDVLTADWGACQL